MERVNWGWRERKNRVEKMRRDSRQAGKEEKGHCGGENREMETKRWVRCGKRHRWWMKKSRGVQAN